MAEVMLLAGRYEVRSCLGKGGMGIVYTAYDRVLEETVAIKVLLGQEAADSSAGRRFRSEIKLARKVTHRNVCRIHDYGEDGGAPFISMQFVEGIDLRTRVRASGGLPADEACDVAGQIAAGLQAIHDEGIVHRDLKSANVMIDGQGVARLMDFGIAKGTEGGESLTGTGHIVGTPEYMSPEQIQAQPLDARSDVYSLGIILFELFTGRVPFSAGTAVAVLMKQLHDAPPLDEPEASTIPPAVRDVIRRALAKVRDHRFGSAKELADALRTARTAARTVPAVMQPSVPAPAVAARPRPPVVKPPPPLEPQPARSGRRMWALLSLPVVALGGLTVWLLTTFVGTRVTGPMPAPTTIASAATASPAAASGPPVVTARPATSAPSTAVPSLGPSALAACNSGQASGCLALYRWACDEGNASGCTRLGVLHNEGRGVEKDLAEAAAFYEQGCEGGDAAGCNNLGTLFEFGQIGVGPDSRRAGALYTRACELGDAQACGNLGVVSLDQPGAVGPAREEAVRFLRQGCAATNRRACRKLQQLGLSP